LDSESSLFYTNPVSVILAMSYESATNFYDFITDSGREGLYSSSQGNMLHPRGEPQGQGSRPGSHSHSSCLVLGLMMNAVVSSGPHVVRNPHNVKTIRLVPASAFNRQGHTWSRDNHQKTYPTQSQIVDRALKGQHHLEKFQDAFFMDAIWGAQEIWRRLPSIEMSVFQESLIGGVCKNTLMKRTTLSGPTSSLITW